MMQHFYCQNGFLKEEVVSTRNYNLRQTYTFSERKNLYESFTGNIRMILFCGIKHGVFNTAKFDSLPELLLARVLERDASSGDVQNWLRPAKKEFNITYNHGHQYEPDFVVETADSIYMCEPKASKNMKDADVLEKKEAAEEYCRAATEFNSENGGKPWKYLLISHDEIRLQSSFSYLAKNATYEQTTIG